MKIIKKVRRKIRSKIQEGIFLFNCWDKYLEEKTGLNKLKKEVLKSKKN